MLPLLSIFQNTEKTWWLCQRTLGNHNTLLVCFVCKHLCFVYNLISSIPFKKHFYPYTAVTQSLLSYTILCASLQLSRSPEKYIENWEIYIENLIFFRWVITYSILLLPLPSHLPHWISSTFFKSGMNIKSFLSKEKLTHKRITVKGGSSFHRAPNPVWKEIRPCKNQTTKWFSPSGTHISLEDPPAPSAVSPRLFS